MCDFTLTLCYTLCVFASVPSGCSLLCVFASVPSGCSPLCVCQYLVDVVYCVYVSTEWM